MLLAWLGCGGGAANPDVAPHRPEQQETSGGEHLSTRSTLLASNQTVQRCTRQSVVLARQTLSHELDTINAFNSIWFNDLDRDELVEDQRNSLASIIVSGLASQLLDEEGQPMFELEASYFRSFNANQLPARLASQSGAEGQHHEPAGQPIAIKLARRHADRCYLHREKNLYTYLLGLTVGPIEHNLDVAYQLPKEFRLGQPVGWRYAQLRVLVPKMNYEVSLRQVANYSLGGGGNQLGCPLELAELAFMGSGQPSKMAVAVVANGLAANNQTLMHLERLFNDYTRPTISRRLRQVLKFYLNSKTLPLSVG